MTRTGQELPVEPAVVRFPEFDDLPWVPVPGPLDRGDNLGSARQEDVHHLTSMPVMRYPRVDPAASLGTICDDSSLVGAVRLRDCSQWIPVNLKR